MFIPDDLILCSTPSLAECEPRRPEERRLEYGLLIGPVSCLELLLRKDLSRPLIFGN